MRLPAALQPAVDINDARHKSQLRCQKGKLAVFDAKKKLVLRLLQRVSFQVEPALVGHRRLATVSDKRPTDFLTLQATGASEAAMGNC